MLEQQITVAELRGIIKNGSSWIVTGGSSASTHRGAVRGLEIGENGSHRLLYHNDYKMIEFRFNDRRNFIFNRSGSKIRIVSMIAGNEVLVLQDLAKLDQNKKDDASEEASSFIGKVRRIVGGNFATAVDDTRNELVLTTGGTTIRIPLDSNVRSGISIAVAGAGHVAIAVERETNECELCGSHESYSIAINGHEVFNKDNH